MEALARAPNGNVLNANNTVNEMWSYSYDDLNRLTAGSQPAIGTSPAQAMSWDYDRFGKRWDQVVTAGWAGQPSFTFSGGNN